MEEDGVTPRIRCAGCLPVIRRCCLVIACVLHFAMSSPAFPIMSPCALHLHTCPSHAFEHFPRCPFCIPALCSPPVAISSFLSCVGIKHLRIGPRFAKRPWYTTGRPPVKFHVIWSPFDTPKVNRGIVKALCVLQPNTPPKWPKNPSKPPPSSRPFDHDRVAENRTPFGLS